MKENEKIKISLFLPHTHDPLHYAEVTLNEYIGGVLDWMESEAGKESARYREGAPPDLPFVPVEFYCRACNVKVNHGFGAESQPQVRFYEGGGGWKVFAITCGNEDPVWVACDPDGKVFDPPSNCEFDLPYANPTLRVEIHEQDFTGEYTGTRNEYHFPWQDDRKHTWSYWPGEVLQDHSRLVCIQRLTRLTHPNRDEAQTNPLTQLIRLHQKSGAPGYARQLAKELEELIGLLESDDYR